MLHRFVVLVNPLGIHSEQPEFVDQVGRATSGWEIAFDARTVQAWVQSAPPSKLNWRPLSSIEGIGCLIGVDFPRVGEPAPGVEGPLFQRWGAFLTVEFDPSNSAVRILRDPSGRINCWMYKHGRTALLFSHLNDVISIIGARLTINWEFLTFHSANRSLHGPSTGYVEIDELLPGEEIEFTQQGASVRSRWSQQSILLCPYDSVEVAIGETRRAAEQAVTAWAGLYDRVTLDLSGGLDSAIVLGLLRTSANHQQVTGINYVIDHPEGDERAFARDAAELHGVRLIEVGMKDAAALPAPSAKNRLLRPGLRAIPLGYDQAGLLAASEVNAQAFFSGTGGDHLFHHNATPTVIVDYFQENGISGILHAAHAEARLSNTTIWDPLSRLVAQALGFRPDITRLVVREHPLLSVPTAKRGNELEYMSSVLRDGRRNLTLAQLIQLADLIEVQSHHWRFGRADVVEEVHPLLSQPLVEACLRTRMHWYSLGGTRRGLAKAVFADLLPKSIATRRSKSSNSSHWLQLLLANLPYYRGIMLEGILSREGLINRPVVDSLLSPLGLSEGKYFSELMNLIALERWLTDAIEIVGLQRSAAVAAA